MWLLFLNISVACLVSSVILTIIRAKSKYKRGRVFDPLRILFVGVILSSIVLFVPIYLNAFEKSDFGIFETLLVSIHSVIRLFIVDGEFEFIVSNLPDTSAVVFKGYTILMAVLFVLAPVLTFGFVLSFFKNVLAYYRYFTHYNADVYIFSQLNNKSLALAKSISENHSGKALLVFMDVTDSKEGDKCDQVERAKELGAICFDKDIASLNFSVHNKKSDLFFFAIGDDESKNIGHALVIADRYKFREHTHLYVFSTQPESEVLMANAYYNENKEVKIKIRRVNEVRSLIMRNLYEQGYDNIFKDAYDDSTGIKRINALVIGMGQHGTEMTKALAWFCQMDGYLVEINSFDIDNKADDKFIARCPELMSEELNGKYDIEGEAKYKITVHSEVDVDTKTFEDIVLSLPKTTYVFVALGNDEKNISIAMKLRSILSRNGCYPHIQAVVYNSDKAEALKGVTNFRNIKYDIDFIGDLNSSYDEKVILHLDMEEEALSRHMRWGSETSFWQYDYNYKSSVASTIHRKMKKLCGIPGIEKSPQDRDAGELQAIRVLEHNRWNAYMRSEGYVYGGTTEPKGRNDIAKTHNCLVPFAQLPPKEQIKDDD